MEANRNSMILAFVAGCVAGMLLLLLVGSIFGKAQAATRVDIPFPPRIEQPVWLPSYVNRKDSWPVSAIFAIPVAAMAVIASAIEAPFVKNNSKNLRKTAGVMVIDAVVGYRKFKEDHPRKRPKAEKVNCRPVGNWVGAPCQ